MTDYVVQDTPTPTESAPVFEAAAPALAEPIPPAPVYVPVAEQSASTEPPPVIP